MNKSVDPRTVEDGDGGTVWEGKDHLMLSVLYPDGKIHSQLIQPRMRFLEGINFPGTKVSSFKHKDILLWFFRFENTLTLLHTSKPGHTKQKRHLFLFQNFLRQ